MKSIRFWTALCFAGLLVGPIPGQSQDTSGFWHIPEQTNPKRLWLVSGSVGGGFAGSMVLLSQYWYAGFDKSSFHFFDDSREWLQIDKAGHLLNSYYISNWARGMFRWTGLPERKAAWIGFGASMVLMSSIEVFDGFSAKWGASWGDLGFNLLGSGLSLGQQLLWQQQRIRVKLSVQPHRYPPDLQPRVDELYGTTVAELVLKDYNATAIWLSVNPGSFLPESSRFPKWLNLALGYGAEGLYGGLENKWIDPQSGLIIDRTDIPRYRQWFLSPDIDLTRIRTRKPWQRTLLEVLSIVKVPAPALEFNPQDGLRWHWLMF